jgi:hypothetical protein
MREALGLVGAAALLAAGCTDGCWLTEAKGPLPSDPEPKEFDVMRGGGPGCASATMSAARFANSQWAHPRTVFECRDGSGVYFSINGFLSDASAVDRACVEGCAWWKYSRGSLVVLTAKVWPPRDSPAGSFIPGFGLLVEINGVSQSEVAFRLVRTLFHSDSRKKSPTERSVGSPGEERSQRRTGPRSGRVRRRERQRRKAMPIQTEGRPQDRHVNQTASLRSDHEHRSRRS